MDEERLSPQVAEAYDCMAAVFDKVTKEASMLAHYQKQMLEHNLALEKLNASFDEVQSRLERVAAVKPRRNLDLS
ncbi:hypothetical protein NDU88_002470 [Pleurodeles waltl]|uniref:Uncharacterized protein n=1 Tax=Pleurodeles waltl TaxID=8319 RepID=A0AAV7NDU7_PLEWA|nr:hypothetical protein NDU88_002470 [Pleurodeles waltl]